MEGPVLASGQEIVTSARRKRPWVGRAHRQARLLALVELGDALDPRRVQALDALGRRAGELDEGRGRGLARDHRRGLGKLDVGLDQVGGGEAVAHGSGPA